jgi:hypothetical protein
LQLGRPEQAANEFQESIEAARSGAALYELALSLRAEAKLRRVPVDGEAEQLFEALQISAVTEAPDGGA